MTDQTHNDTQRPGGNQFTEGLERVWSEIKEISRQVERETRRTGRAARLKLDLRKLMREQDEVRARLGKAVHEAYRQHGGDLPLHEVQGLAAGVAALDALAEQIHAKQAEADSLRDSDAPEPPLQESGEVA
jgi:transposase